MNLELSHDTLAKAIYDKASREDKMLVKKQNFVNRRYKYYLASNVLLDGKDLDRVMPHLNKLNLDREVLFFVRRSQNYTQRRQWAIVGAVLIVSLTLLMFGIQAGVTFYDLQVNISNKKAISLALKEAQEKRALAENKAQRLLDGTDANSPEDLQNINVVKQLIIKYDTLGKEQTDITKQRDLAQSATLSNLAATALAQNDKTYALQLASKAWELNPENKQSLEILEKINQQEAIAFADFSSNKQAALVEKSQRTTGKLKEQDLEAIFSKENEVVQNHALGIQRSISSSKGSPRTPSAAMATPSLYNTIQQNEDVKPILEAVKESLEPEKLDRKTNCFLAQKDVDKWLPVKEKKIWSLFVKYASDGKLYVQIVWNKKQDNKPLPQLSQLRFSSAEQVRVVRLIKQPDTKGRSIYMVVLNKADDDWLKDTRIIGFSFAIDELDLSKYEAFEKEFYLEDEVQNKLITMGKCLL
ncbi:MAG: Unknown protein [uncultured Aureispira sp.]|uniref:Uncharacterized protein n=1 Tax=uncultured Aureispira sp. TaxID=1331704 RepID=A0A6S6SFS4_9BACT|nr:MAG: Unknown protein [uncultured Aureispira sp.]